MNFTEDGFKLARSKMLGDFTKAIADAEDLRKTHTQAAAKAAGVTAGAAGDLTNTALESGGR
jgi:hypothetical protein